jgi:hypothetical protein
LNPITKLAKGEIQAVEHTAQQFADFLSLVPTIIWH